MDSRGLIDARPDSEFEVEWKAIIDFASHDHPGSEVTWRASERVGSGTHFSVLMAWRRERISSTDRA